MYNTEQGIIKYLEKLLHSYSQTAGEAQQTILQCWWCGHVSLKLNFIL